MFDAIMSIYKRIDSKNLSYAESVLRDVINISVKNQSAIDDLLLEIDCVFSSRSIAIQRTLVDSDILVRESDRKRGADIPEESLN